MAGLEMRASDPFPLEPAAAVVLECWGWGGEYSGAFLTLPKVGTFHH